MAEIAYDSVSKVYDDGTQAVYDLDLEIEDGELMVLVGPSGCGKTTALRMLAGLEEITEGEIRIGERVNGAAQTLGLNEVLPKKPRTLSGGQRQRVAMGRAIVREPRAFLMDEPLSNLDAKLRVEMRAEIARLQRELNVTTIYVTHDQVEAMTLGDRVAIMRDGLLQQVAKPQDLYDRPRNLFVAEFIGSPAMNLIGVDLSYSDGRVVAKFGDSTLEVGEQVLVKRPGLAAFEGKRIILGVRPEDLEDEAFATDASPGRRLSAQVDIREDMGSEVFIHFGVAGKAVRGADVKAAVGEDAIEVAEAKGNVWVARVDRDTNAQEGGNMELVVDTSRLHFFDPENGEAIY